jgi:HK97 family phage prohead protease
MPYFISNEQDDCDGWATIYIEDDGTIETIGCHQNMNDAVAQMVAVSLDEGIDPGGEYERSESRAVTSFQTSDWPMFDRRFAEMVKNDHPDIWDAGGNIKGDDQYTILTRIAEQGGAADTDDQVAALELREAWVARHRDNFRLAGVVAQMKWLAIGSRGEDYMKNLIREEIESERASSQGERRPMKRAELNNVREVRQWGVSDIEVREAADSDSLTFSGYATVFNADYTVGDSFGEFTERIAPGAFTRTLDENPDVILNVNHAGLPLARTKSGTLKLTQDKVGLRVSAELDRSDPDVQAILPKMRRGDLDEMSFAFRVTKQEWSDDYLDRTITEVNLSRGDVSIVSFGANPTTVAALRAALADEDVRAQLFAELDEQRVLTTATSDEAEADEVEAAPVEVADDPLPPAAEADVDELDDGDDEERGGGLTGSVPAITYHLTQLVDRRLPA